MEKPRPMYVPRDEAFEEMKQDTFTMGRLKAVLHNLIPSLIASINAENHDFKGFADIDRLYKEGLQLKVGLQDELIKKLPLPKVVTDIQESSQGLLRYDTPTIVSSEPPHLISSDCIFLAPFTIGNSFDGDQRYKFTILNLI